MRLSFVLDICYAQVLPIRLGGVLIGYFGGMIFTKFLFLDMHLYRCILHVMFHPVKNIEYVNEPTCEVDTNGFHAISKRKR